MISYMANRNAGFWSLTLALSALGLSLGACASTNVAPSVGTSPLQGETIAWSVRPCFGFCPIYKVAVSPAGAIKFEGERHTAVLGQKERSGGPAAYQAALSALAVYRPATGTTSRTTCEQQISDQSTTRITWTTVDGAVTVLEHDRGCRSADNDVLNEALQTLPDRLGIADWAKQVTRHGASRG